MHIPLVSGVASTTGGYATLTVLHGSLMVFLVLTTAPQAGFGKYFLTLQLGARNLAFPYLNLLSFWLTVVLVAHRDSEFAHLQHPAGLMPAAACRPFGRNPVFPSHARSRC